ncbi:hypothetical protein DL93DRAFT_2069693 [Clavulina sp. PMI_390]|nr:hypothetical protein DL93DRAFT_2069693 [Clavulina sp. PMI_390]
MAVVLPVLSTFHRDVSNQDPNQEDDAQDDWARTIRRFVRTIVTSPRGAELGKLVQDLTIDLGLNWEPSNDPRAHYWYSSDLDRCRRVFTLEEIEPTLLDGKTGPQQVIARELAEIAKAVTTSVSEPGSSPNQSSAKGKIDNGLIVQGRYHGLALVLLYHLPSLKTLKIEANGDMETIALSALDFFDSGVPPGLASIRELELVCANEKVRIVIARL